MLKIKKEDSYQLNENKEEKKYFKKAFIYGSVGVGIGITDFILSNKLGVESLFKPFKEMNPHEIITNLYSGISFISALGGGIMYGVYSLFEQQDKKPLRKEIKSLEISLKN